METSYESMIGSFTEPPNTGQDILPTISSSVLKDNELRNQLLCLPLKEENVEFILENGMKFIDTPPRILDIKLKIGQEKAEKVIEILKMSQPKNMVFITKEIRKSIDSVLKDYPDVNNPEEIALILDISKDVVVAHLDSKPLTKHQKKSVVKLYNKNCSVHDIMDQLHISNRKILEHLAATIIVFDSKEGNKVLEIIYKHCDKLPVSKLREMIINNDLKLQDKLYILSKKNEFEYLQIFNYFKKFKESEKFLLIDTNLTMDDIIFIKESNLYIEQLCMKLNKVESVIRDYLHAYEPHYLERNHYKQSQQTRIKCKIRSFGTTPTFHSYRMIVSDSIEDIIDRAKRIKDSTKVFKELLPLTLYYLKCSLPFEDITRIIFNTCNEILTTHEVFHLIFQLSDPIVRGFCIENYSFSNPVPLYYPKISPVGGSPKEKFEICSELWYSIQKYNCLISFGLGRAGWNRTGKSYLLDLIFETDFVKGSPRESAFHMNSIDIQMTKNLFAAVKDRNCKESTKWAYIDCHGYTDISVVNKICKYLGIAVIHISYYDYLHNREKVEDELFNFRYLEHIYICIRDFEGSVKIERKDKKSPTYIYIPNLGNTDNTSSYTTLKEIGYEILHLKSKTIGDEFIEGLMDKFNTSSLKEIQLDKKCLQTIMTSIMERTKSFDKLDFSFLDYYPYFIDYMNSFYTSANETDRDIIRAHNVRCVDLKEDLDKTQMGKVVQCFNDILERKNCVLLLWKLSQELAVLTNQIINCSKGLLSHPDESCETQKNDKYNLEIIWREALLSSKYGKEAKSKVQDMYREQFITNFSNYVEIGEAFELIDGDNLRYFNQDINGLLAKLYMKQKKELAGIKKNKTPMRQAPIIVSILGPQSSGKSTLLNYCFGCKFLTSAGRCTRGIYGSLCKLSKPVNCTNQFLILDTEGLDAIERGNDTDTSLVNFDRTMVLFCLAVSQVVIINIKGEIGNEMQNLLQICAYSLHKLKVSKVVAPKIFFVLNQQADPDPEKFLPAINKLLDKLNKESDLMEIEGFRISDLIQVSKENLYILPSAFNSQQMNKPEANLFQSKVTKQSPTFTFAVECAKLRLAIINELIEMPLDERATFKTMSEWMEMSGVIWDIIVKYQDIVKFRNVGEMMCSNKLSKAVTDILKKNITANQKEFATVVDFLIVEIKEIKFIFNKNEVLGDKMLKFNETFEKYHDKCYDEFDKICQKDKISKNMTHICEAAKSNLARLLYIEKKYYRDKLFSKIKVVWTDLNLSDLMGKFQKAIDVNVDKYLECNSKELETSFEKIWIDCFGDDSKEEETERNEDFDNLYSIFKMESKTMENKQNIFEYFDKLKFDMNQVIKKLQTEILEKLESYVDSFSNEVNYIFPWKENTVPLKDMIPYTGRDRCEYLRQDSLFFTKKGGFLKSRTVVEISKWIPVECHGLIQYCSGYYNHADITWNMEDRKQILLLASSLKDPDNHKVSTWLKLVHKISSEVLSILERGPQISKGTVKEIMHSLCVTFRIVNYEINYIQAKLTNKAERTMTTYVFAYAFKHLLEGKSHRAEYNATKQSKKVKYLDFFLQKVESRKLAKGNWDRKKMREIDKNISNKFALDFINNVRRGIINDENPFIEQIFLDQSKNLSHKSIFLLMNEVVSKEIQSHSEEEVWDQKNIVIQYICNRNEVVKKIFQGRWEEVVDNIYCEVLHDIRNNFLEQIRTVKDLIENLLKNLLEKAENELRFDSDSNFERADKADLLEYFREIPCRALMLYLEMYFDPAVTPENLNAFFDGTFNINDVEMMKMKDWVLCEKPKDPNLVLDKEVSKKLQNTKIFNKEKIFNISVYLKKFLSTLNCYEFELLKSEFENLECVKKFKDDHEASVLSCPEQCPSCGKPCDRELHPHSGKCQIKTGHLICSMGGKVWQNDEDKTAVLLSCDDYKDSTEVKIPGKRMKWGEFKDETGNEWDWSLPADEDYKVLQLENREKMKNIWNIFGKGILNYHAEKGKIIKYIPYTSFEDVLKSIQSYEFNICFVIDGTGSMRSDIDKARISVGQLISHYRKQGHVAEFAIVIYRDHCDGKDIILMFPDNGQFTFNHRSVQEFLQEVKVFGGGDGPEAVLDGLATAVRNWNWSKKKECRNVIIHIFDAPPHGNFPDYKSHSSGSSKGNCCCCSGLCKFDWERDVWDKMRSEKIKYHGISTGGDFPSFQGTMRDKLGDLFGDLQSVDREMVNDAVVQIFIDYS